MNHVLQLLTEQGHDGFAEGLRLLVNEAMRVERQRVLQAQPYERTDTRQGHANGCKPKPLASRGGPITFRVPQVRGATAFEPSTLEKGFRSEQAPKLALAEMSVQGGSTRKVSAMVEELCGTTVSSTQVSDCAKRLDAELLKWRDRPLGQCPSLGFDARYEKVRHDGQLRDGAVLLALVSTPEGQRVILGVSVVRSEAEVPWRAFYQSLVRRGLCGVTFMVSDDPPGLAAARQAVLGAVPWQRCQFPSSKTPRPTSRVWISAPRWPAPLAALRMPHAPGRRATAQGTCHPLPPEPPPTRGLAGKNLPQGFTVFTLPAARQKRLHTANALERVNQELKRRTRAARGFPNEQSLLRLITALLCETSDDWETGKIHRNMENQNPPSV